MEQPSTASNDTNNITAKSSRRSSRTNNDSTAESDPKSFTTSDSLGLELTAIAKENSKMFLGSDADAAGGFDKPLISDEVVGPNSNCNNEENAFDYNEDDEVNGDSRHEIEEHMVSQKEDDWVRTLAGVAGNVLEWYDFAVFGYFSDILGDVFFPPNQDGHAAIVESFAVFGGAFLMRPS